MSARAAVAVATAAVAVVAVAAAVAAATADRRPIVVPQAQLSRAVYPGTAGSARAPAPARRAAHAARAVRPPRGRTYAEWVHSQWVWPASGVPPNGNPKTQEGILDHNAEFNDHDLPVGVTNIDSGCARPPGQRSRAA